MRNSTGLAAVTMAIAALAGCSKKSDQPANQTPTTLPDQANFSEQAKAEKSPSQAFADEMAAGDTFEIESSRLAETKSASASVKKFAAAMIKAHTDSTAKLNEAAGKAAPPIVPKPILTANQQQMLDALKGKKGAEFDSAYVEAQQKAHQMTLDLLKNYNATGDTPPLKALAASLIPIVTGHFNMANGLKS